MVGTTGSLLVVSILVTNALFIDRPVPGQLTFGANRSHHVLNGGCPQFCNCMLNNARCENKNLTNFPEALPETTTILLLGRNNITSLNDMPYLPKLIILMMDKNKIEELKVDHFNLLPSLRVLVMHQNLVKSLDFTVFSNLSKVSYVDMRENNISTLLLSKLPLSLKEIRLNHNNISTIEVDPNFYHQRNYTTIDLSGNPIHCDCSLVKFLQRAVIGNVTVFGTCETPTALSGIHFNQTEDAMQCKGDTKQKFESNADDLRRNEVVLGMTLCSIAIFTKLFVYVEIWMMN